MSRWSFMVALIAGCTVGDSAPEPLPEPSEVTNVAACRRNCPPPPEMFCELDATGHETGYCISHQNGACSYGVYGVTGCLAGRAGTPTTNVCGVVDQNPCTATGWYE